jgi:hypothetical protein
MGPRSFASLPIERQKEYVVDYLLERLGDDDALKAIICQDDPDGFTVTVAVEDFWGEVRSRAHRVFRAFRRAFRPTRIGFLVGQAGVVEASDGETAWPEPGQH